MTIPLEDTYSDIISKARRGQSFEVADIAAKAGVSEEAAASAFGGEFDEKTVRALAAPLGLQPDRVVAIGRGSYVAAPVSVDGLAQFNTRWDEEDMTVNAYLVWDKASGVAIAFDTGMDCDGILEKAKAEGVKIALILLTHSHGDHIYDLDRLKEKTGAPAWIGEKELVDGGQPFSVGKTFSAGGLTVETRSTWGHCKGGITYVVSGLSTPIAIVGDALFAGSMGGGGISYADALKTNRESLFTLSGDTVVCPGHGPLTTIGEQKKVNPFYPEF